MVKVVILAVWFFMAFITFCDIVIQRKKGDDVMLITSPWGAVFVAIFPFLWAVYWERRAGKWNPFQDWWDSIYGINNKNQS